MLPALSPPAPTEPLDVARLFEADQARVRGQWVRVVGLAQQVTKLAPGHAGAAALINEVRAQVKDLYLRAYQLKDVDPHSAAALFDQVIAVTPPDDAYHLKAQARRAELEDQK